MTVGPDSDAPHRDTAISHYLRKLSLRRCCHADEVPVSDSERERSARRRRRRRRRRGTAPDRRGRRATGAEHIAAWWRPPSRCDGVSGRRADSLRAECHFKFSLKVRFPSEDGPAPGSAVRRRRAGLRRAGDALLGVAPTEAVCLPDFFACPLSSPISHLSRSLPLSLSLSLNSQRTTLNSQLTSLAHACAFARTRQCDKTRSNRWRGL